MLRVFDLISQVAPSRSTVLTTAVEGACRCSHCRIRSITRCTPAVVDRYKVEPYVIAADVYSVAPHVGRGGWTWYTGSAAWMYRAGILKALSACRQGHFTTASYSRGGWLASRRLLPWRRAAMRSAS